MEQALYKSYCRILEEELAMAMGCTEPVAVAYAAAIARAELGILPEEVDICVSGNIIKNVKSVIVPNTGGLHGLEAAAAAGIVAGEPQKKLLVISGVDDDQKRMIREYLKNTRFTVRESDADMLFDIQIRLSAGEHTSFCRITDTHTHVVCVEKDGMNHMDEIQAGSEEILNASKRDCADRDLLTVEKIVEFAETVKLEDVMPVLRRQVECNMAISQEGMRHGYGARIGQILLEAYGNDVHTRAKAMAAAGSDARMSGCELPVVINSGSGNQGITVSVPVVVYAQELHASEDTLYRALTVSNLTAIHLKSGIGSLSAYCGATTAGCGAGAGICYLMGGRFREIAHTIANGLAIDSGMVCDGAKASCAAKIASAVEAGLLGMHMYRQGSEFHGGDGIVTKGIENTIRNIGRLARDGMRKTDREIIQIMLS